MSWLARCQNLIIWSDSVNLLTSGFGNGTVTLSSTEEQNQCCIKVFNPSKGQFNCFRKRTGKQNIRIQEKGISIKLYSRTDKSHPQNKLWPKHSSLAEFIHPAVSVITLSFITGSYERPLLVNYDNTSSHNKGAIK